MDVRHRDKTTGDRRQANLDFPKGPIRVRFEFKITPHQKVRESLLNCIPMIRNKRSTYTCRTWRVDSTRRDVLESFKLLENMNLCSPQGLVGE